MILRLMILLLFVVSTGAAMANDAAAVKAVTDAQRAAAQALANARQADTTAQAIRAGRPQ